MLRRSGELVTVMKDMSDEDAAKFEAHREALEKLRSTARGAALLAVVEEIGQEAAHDLYEAARVLAPIALNVGKEVLISFASAALEKELSKLTK